MENTSSKTKVYNVIIMDRSGSMWDIQKSAIQGYNEVLGGIKADAKTYAETQAVFEKEKKARARHSKMMYEFDASMPCASAEERRAYRKKLSEEYYKEEE